jgi:hypothetical protein
MNDRTCSRSRPSIRYRHDTRTIDPAARWAIPTKVGSRKRKPARQLIVIAQRAFIS